MKFSLRKAKKATSLFLAFIMMLGLVEGITFNAFTTTVKAEDNPLTTIWKTSNIGGCAGGAYNYDTGSKKVTLTGAGTTFDKDNGNDNLFYAFFDAKGEITITAKMTAATSVNATGFAGIMVRNSADDATSQSEALYADFNKDQIRYGRHGSKNGASKLSDSKSADTVYLKLNVKEDGKVYYYVSTTGTFDDTTPAKAETLTGIDSKVVGFFATENVTAEFSDIRIESIYTDDLGNQVQKIVFDSNLGELIPTFSKSSDYAGKYDGYSFSQTADGNILKLVSTRGNSNGKIREGENVDYLLFPALTDNCTVSANFTINDIKTNTDRQGVSIGQFINTGSAVASSNLAGSSIQATKNANAQHVYSTAAGSASGDPKASPVAFNEKKTYYFSYQKNSITDTAPSGSATMLVKAADGTVLSNDAVFDLSNAHSMLAAGQPVQYGIAITAADIDVTNLKLVNSEGWVIYDQNDYYKAAGVAPVVTEITTAQISADRTQINLEWTFTEGVGNQSFIVMVSKDGGAYTGAGVVTTNTFSYSPSADGTYKFKIYGKAGDSSSEASAVESADILYITPIATPVLTTESKDASVVIGYTIPDGADVLELYRSTIRNGSYEKIQTFTSGTSFTDENLTNDQPYFYYAIAKNTATNNTSNPSETMQTLPNAGHAGDFVYGSEAALITIVEKSNDTVTEKNASIKAKSSKAGTAVLVVNGENKASKKVAANEEFSFTITELKGGRNDVEIRLTDETNKVSRKVFNFVYLKSYDIVVDAAYTGTDGEGELPTYKTVKAAIASVPNDNAETKVIFIKNGNYNERLEIATPNISLLGEDSVKTRIYYSAAVNDKTATGMWDRNCVYVDAAAVSFSAENLTIENSFNYTNGNDQQADAIAVTSDKTVFTNVRFIGYQDTILTDPRNSKDADGNYLPARQYFNKCYVTGNVDFIYGAGTAYFNDCEIVGRYTSYKKDGCYTAARTYANLTYGLVFNNCSFTAEDGVEDAQYRLARPWGKDAATVFINCFIDKNVQDVGYGDMSGNSYKNARFAEYYTYGPAFKVNNDRPLLSAAEAKNYSLSSVMGDFDATGFATLISNAYAGGSTPVEPSVPKTDIVCSTTLPESVLTTDIKEKTGCSTIPELISFMQKTVVKDSYESASSTVYDVVAKISTDGGITWVEATKDTMPKDGVDVILPYPEGTNMNDYNFVVSHLIVNDWNGQVPGTVEWPEITKTDKGLKVHVMSLSPFAVAWKQITANEVNTEEDEYDENPVVQSVNTGDTTNFTAIMLFMILSITVIGVEVLLYYRRRRVNATKN